MNRQTTRTVVELNKGGRPSLYDEGLSDESSSGFSILGALEPQRRRRMSSLIWSALLIVSVGTGMAVLSGGWRSHDLV